MHKFPVIGASSLIILHTHGFMGITHGINVWVFRWYAMVFIKSILNYNSWLPINLEWLNLVASSMIHFLLSLSLFQLLELQSIESLLYTA